MGEGYGYGHWSHGKGPPSAESPMALILFSGRPRPGDLAHCLNELGWITCSVDTAAETPTNVLDDGIWAEIEKDIRLGMFDGLWVGTPCGTFSPLRNTPPGPRPLRDVGHIQGLPTSQLRLHEQKQLKEANILVDRSAVAAELQGEKDRPWGWENPDHGEDKVSIWKMPKVKKLRESAATREYNFDQCRTELDTVKPTKFLVHKLDFTELEGLRCDHPKKMFKRSDGTEYWASHESALQRWVTGPTGKLERASRSQGEYTPKLCGIIARAMHKTASEGWRRRELEKEQIP